jgi:outer membrane protein TolC
LTDALLAESEEFAEEDALLRERRGEAPVPIASAPIVAQAETPVPQTQSDFKNTNSNHTNSNHIDRSIELVSLEQYTEPGSPALRVGQGLDPTSASDQSLADLIQASAEIRTQLAQAEFAVVAALKSRGMSSDADAYGDLPADDLTMVGCGLFGENPPLKPDCIDLGLGTIRSIIHPCGMQYLAPYIDLADQFPNWISESAAAAAQSADGSSRRTTWWDQQVVTPTRPDAISIPLSIETLMVRTLANSKYLKGLADLPLIREKSTMEAIAEFDVTTFVESRFRRPSEPVGNDLTVGPGGSRRFREDDFSASAGISRKTSRGGRVELAQQVGLLTNNSTFINPRHQGNTQLKLNLTQPLLSGAGKPYNTSLIMLAKMDERIAWDQVSEQLQDYLVEVTENYWQLYLERSRLQQKHRHLQRGEAILSELEARREIDAVENQIARARAAIQTRRTELIRAKAQVRNVESQLRGLVNDPEFYASTIELIPSEAPHCTPLNLTVNDAMSQALQTRSEIDNAIQKVRAAGVRLSVAKNELLPILDVVLETYLSGLQGQNDIAGAWLDQFTVGEPSYSAGIRYEIPIGNRMAKNRHRRRRLEMRQAISQFQFEVEGLMSEVDIAVREVDTTYQEMQSRYDAMNANEVDLAYFQKRWELMPGDNRSTSFLLEDILDAQDRVASQEANFAQSQVNYAMSIVNLKRALGILMQSEQIETSRACENGLEKYEFNMFGGTTTPVETYVEQNALPLVSQTPKPQRSKAATRSLPRPTRLPVQQAAHAGIDDGVIGSQVRTSGFNSRSQLDEKIASIMGEAKPTAIAKPNTAAKPKAIGQHGAIPATKTVDPAGLRSLLGNGSKF